MKELVFNTGGRRFFNEDLQALQELSKSFESLYQEADPFAISGVQFTRVGSTGTIYNISAGYVWLGNRVRRFEGAVNIDMSTPKYINVRDTNENREYNDTLQKVAATSYGCTLSSTTLGGVNSLRLETTPRVRRYITDVLGSQVLLLSPLSTLQTVGGNLKFTGTLTVDGAVTINNSLTAGAMSGSSLSLTSSFTLGGKTLTGLNTSATLADSTQEAPSSYTVKTHVAGQIGAHGVPKGAILMWSGTIAGIPSGWVLCDGRAAVNSQIIPDLRGKFIVGYNENDPDFSTVGKNAGAKDIFLSSSQLPQHTHAAGTLSANSNGAHTHGVGTLVTASAGGHYHTGSTTTNGDHYHTTNAPTRGGESTDNGSGHHVQNNEAAYATTGWAGAHSHTFTTNTTGAHTHTISGDTGSAGAHTHTISGATGGVHGTTGEAIRILPPYYTLAFIIKTV
jgi:microcystin-dependent protein